jgi:hypothetical protein
MGIPALGRPAPRIGCAPISGHDTSGMKVALQWFMEENPMTRVVVPIFVVAYTGLMIYAFTLQARIWHLF